MKIAIHGPDELFSGVWIDYCQRQRFAFKLVDCLADDIVQQVQDCDIVMWQHRHFAISGKLLGRPVLTALEQAGKIVFPDHRTAWHFDDKLAQKYLLEAIGAPTAPTTVLVNEDDAHAWAARARYPVVFKLRGGAGATHVRLVRSAADAHRLVAKAFGAGFSQHDALGDLKETLYRHRQGKEKASEVLRSVERFVTSTPFARQMPRERSYVLFQQFFADNRFDVKVVTVGERACAIKRMVRPEDFRASGSGLVHYAREDIDERCVQIAFDTTRRLGVQCMGYDFVFDGEGRPYIIEMSYGFSGEVFRHCTGYWDGDLGWHAGPFRAEEWMVDAVVAQYRSRTGIGAAGGFTPSPRTAATA